ncbi:MAG: LexA family transcriptional regulator [Methylobacter sp.]|nr:LexA family transcriptional regulator [Methylobacter sp.]
MDSFADRIELLISVAGSGSEFSRKCGVSDSTVRKWRNSESDPTRKRLLAIAEAFDVTLVWLLTGEGDMHMPPKPKLQYELNSSPSVSVSNSVKEVAPESHSAGSRPAEADTAWDGFALVAMYDVQASAGHGNNVDSELQMGQLAFKKSWLREKGLEVGHLAIITAKGDSMERTIYDGDILLVDTRIDKIIDDSIYIIERVDDHLIVKRLQQQFDGSVSIISDNPRYKEQTLSPEQAKTLKIAGRVCWYGHEI